MNDAWRTRINYVTLRNASCQERRLYTTAPNSSAKALAEKHRVQSGQSLSDRTFRVSSPLQQVPAEFFLKLKNLACAETLGFLITSQTGRDLLRRAGAKFRVVHDIQYCNNIEELRMAGPFEGVLLNHIARETENVHETARFYREVFGFERIETPKEFGNTVIWLKLPPSHSLHIIKRKPESRLPESPFTSADDARRDESALQTGHHLSFRVSDYDSAIELLKEKSIRYFEKTQQEGTIKQAFFFDPDGNGLEIGNWPINS